MEWLIALGLGLLAGLHTSTWGIYKDAPYEGYSLGRYLRSTFISTALAVPAAYFSDLNLLRPGHMLVFWGLVYVLERAIMEYYKTFLREEDQSKYFIPMTFHVQGEVVTDRKKRLLIGLAYLAGVSAAVAGVVAANQAGLGEQLWAVLLIGSIGGWISAFGGAWKDAPIEGFELLKFFRSPALAAFYAWVMSQFTSNLVLITFPALGYTIATTETYKTFFFPSKPRGKFAGKPVEYPEVLEWRTNLVPLYVAIWCVVIGIGVAAFLLDT
ncbi:MAG: hypothetical protein D6761_13085 [Candidatus Dadabacteria bacterium]|nr:MAG: hypothetical protein D6761_13085 [Candidatus Dadabacteria bacterium]